MDLFSEISLRGVRSPLSEYRHNFVTDRDEQEVIKDSAGVWQDGLTADITHWQINRSLSQRHAVFDEWTMAIYGDPFVVKGRIDITPSEDLMHVIGTGRNFDGILTVHRALLDNRTLDVADMFSCKGQFYGVSYITPDNLFKEWETFLVFGLYKRNTPELEGGVNMPVVKTN